MPHRPSPAPLSLLLLALSTLACATLQPSPAPDTPITRATPTPRATTTPRPTNSGPVPSPLAPLDFDFAEAETLLSAAMLPEFAADVTRFPDLTRYAIDVEVTFANNRATLTGRERIVYTNPYPEALNEIYLMLWPNEPTQYLGALTLGEVQVNGAIVEPTLENDDLAARLDLATPLEPGASVTIEAAFTAEARGGLEDEGGRYGLSYDLLVAPTFYPLIPRQVAGAWQTTLPASGGDTTNSDSAFYVWRVTAPAEMTIVATGSQVEAVVNDDTQTQVFVTGPMRDLALIVGELEHRQEVRDGITFNAYVLPFNADYADELLDYGVAQTFILSDHIGPYPFAELDLVDTPGTYGGVEYPGLVFIGVVGGDSGDFFEIATVHEVGHQWFYSLIGDDQLLEPWLDEAAASYTELLYYEAIGDEAGYEAVLEDSMNWTESVADPEKPIGLPVADYDDYDYGAIVYGKGTLFFHALRAELGDDVFFEFLQAYYAEYRYGFATSAAFHATAEATCACELDEFFDTWVYEGGPYTVPAGR